VTHEERAFATLTLLVAVAERAIDQLGNLEPPPQDLVDELVLVHDDVRVVTKRLASRGYGDRVA
jgi:hypothetical protein